MRPTYSEIIYKTQADNHENTSSPSVVNRFKYLSDNNYDIPSTGTVQWWFLLKMPRRNYVYSILSCVL